MRDSNLSYNKGKNKNYIPSENKTSSPFKLLIVATVIFIGMCIIGYSTIINVGKNQVYTCVGIGGEMSVYDQAGFQFVGFVTHIEPWTKLEVLNMLMLSSQNEPIQYLI